METVSENKPMWTSINEVPYTYDWMSHDENCQICVIGGGVTGALCCLKCVEAGIDTVLISSEPIASASTSKLYGVMRVGINEGMYNLAENVGVNNATHIYSLFRDSIDDIEQICSSLDNKCGFKRSSSIIFTMEKANVDLIQKEYALLRKGGFDVSLLTKQRSLEKLPFEVELGLVFNNLAAVVDPYLFTHEVIKKCESLGARIYENSKIDFVGNEQDMPYAVTSMGHKIVADKMISAVGSDVLEFLGDAGEKRTGFAIVTESISDFSDFENTCLISCIDKPGISFSVTPDKRLISSGLDCERSDTFRRLSRGFGYEGKSKFENKKFDSLSEGLSYYFPWLCNTPTEFAFSTDYIQTENGLPIIGEMKNLKNFSYALCSGQNSIVFADIISNTFLDGYMNDINTKGFLEGSENRLLSKDSENGYSYKH